MRGASGFYRKLIAGARVLVTQARAKQRENICFFSMAMIVCCRALFQNYLLVWENAPSAVCSYGQWRAINEQDELMPPKMKLTSRYSGCVLEDLLKRGFLIPGCALLRRVFFLAIARFDERIAFAEDWEFFCRLSLEGDFLPIADCVAGYRLRTTSKSATSNTDRVAKVYATIDRVLGNPKLKDHFSNQKLKRLKKISRACGVLEILMRDFWEGHCGKSVKIALIAVKIIPSSCPGL